MKTTSSNYVNSFFLLILVLIGLLTTSCSKKVAIQLDSVYIYPYVLKDNDNIYEALSVRVGVTGNNIDSMVSSVRLYSVNLPFYWSISVDYSDNITNPSKMDYIESQLLSPGNRLPRGEYCLDVMLINGRVIRHTWNFQANYLFDNLNFITADNETDINIIKEGKVYSLYFIDDIFLSSKISDIDDILLEKERLYYCYFDENEGITTVTYKKMKKI